MAEILVEVRPRLVSRKKAGEASPKPAIPEKLSKRLGDLTDTLNELATRIGGGLDELSAKPAGGGFRVEEIEVKVNIDLESEAGVVIARAKASAGFEASITWKRA
jgi:hypothetical protein